MAVLVYTDAADGVERSLTVTAEPILIGRNPECTIRSTDGRVSRMHARLYCDHTGTTYIEDLGSSNGVYVGQTKVQHSPIPIGEIVVVGSLTFRILEGGGQAAMPQPHGHYGQQPQGYAPQAYGQSPQAQFTGDQYTAPAAYPPQPPGYAAPDPYGGQYGAPPGMLGHGGGLHGGPPAMPPPQDAAPAMPSRAATPHAAPPAMPPPEAAAPSWTATPPHAAAPAMPPPGAAAQSWTATPPQGAPHAPPSAMPPPQVATPPQGAPQVPPPAHVDGAIAHLLEVERKARLSAEEERDAYGARMAQLHGELRAAKEAVAQAEAAAAGAASGAGASSAAMAQLQQELRVAKEAVTKAKSDAVAAAAKADSAMKAEAAAKAETAAIKAKPVNPPHVEALAVELESYRVKLVDATEALASAEARLKSTEDELGVARQDVLAAEDRIISEVAAAESRASAELQSRVEELEVTRADLIKAEDRNMDLERKIAELKERLARLGVESD